MKKYRKIWLREVKKYIKKWQLRPELSFGGDSNE